MSDGPVPGANEKYHAGVIEFGDINEGDFLDVETTAGITLRDVGSDGVAIIANGGGIVLQEDGGEDINLNTTGGGQVLVNGAPVTGGGAPSGPAGGSLAGTYPNPSLGVGVVVAATLGAGAVTNPAIAAAAVALANMADLAAARVIGRASGAGTGVPTALTGTQLTALLNAFTTSLAGLAPASGGGTANFLRADGTWAAPPTGGAPTGAAGGDLTGSTYPNPTIAAAAVTLAKMADLAASTVIGRAAGAGTGVPTALTSTQLTALVAAFSSSLSGAAPASGGGTANFLRADGTWAVPPGSGGGSTQEGAQAITSADVTLVSGTVIPWNAEAFDDSGYHTTGGSNSRLTIPAGKGGAGTRFRLDWCIDIDNTVTSSWQFFAQKNGTIRMNGPIKPLSSSLADAQGGWSGTAFLDAPADGDFFEVLPSRLTGAGTVLMNHLYDAGGVGASFFTITKLK